MSAVSRACATSADAMPAPSPRPRSRGRVATPDGTSLTSLPSTSTGCGTRPPRLAVVDGDHHDRAAGRDPLAQDRSAGVGLGGVLQRPTLDVHAAAGMGEGDRRDLLVAGQLRVVGADEVERRTPAGSISSTGSTATQQRQLVDAEPRGARGRRDLR